ncbi:MAG TPA: hypothetical protein GX702_01490 [Chloroflexi bacterium]|jgi:predicted  nucleic acid-binding Zn-ribbon protein|nr:hypothetical protein [Chloroflexota bacterium]
MTLLQTLHELQEIDQEWVEKGRLYQTVRRQIADQSNLQAMRDAQTQREEEQTATRNSLRDIELEMEGLQERLRQTDSELYSGRISSPRELEALRQDAEVLRQRISRLEEQALDTMSRIDALQEATESGRQALRDYEAWWAGEHEALVTRYRELHARLQALQRRRDEIRAALGRAELALYDELRAKKGGIALAPMKEGTCQTCRVTVPSHKIRMVHSGESVVTCEGCGRILFEEMH